MGKPDIRNVLETLGKKHAFDILILLKEKGHLTATDVAKHLNLHVATAVKHLSDLNEAGVIEKRVRKGKTRSAYEYWLKEKRLVLEIDFDDIIQEQRAEGVEAKFIFMILCELTKKMGTFLGKNPNKLIMGWRSEFGEENMLNALTKCLDSTFEDAWDWLSKKDEEIDAIRVSTFINKLLEVEEETYGFLSMRSLAKASLKPALAQTEYHISTDDLLELLPSKYYGKVITSAE